MCVLWVGPLEAPAVPSKGGDSLVMLLFLIIHIGGSFCSPTRVCDLDSLREFCSRAPFHVGLLLRILAEPFPTLWILPASFILSPQLLILKHRWALSLSS